MNLTELKYEVEDKAVEYLNAIRLEALEEKALDQLNKSAGNGYVRLHKREFSALLNAVRGLHRKRQTLEAAVQSRHDYGPASPGEQEAAWQAYCQRVGWNPSEHPAAKNAYCEGFCDGDSYSDGDESRAVLRAELSEAVAERDRLKTRVKDLERFMNWIATVNERIDLRKLDSSTLVGLVHELRGDAEAALKDTV